jgi:hypothetical protein
LHSNEKGINFLAAGDSFISSPDSPIIAQVTSSGSRLGNISLRVSLTQSCSALPFALADDGLILVTP